MNKISAYCLLIVLLFSSCVESDALKYNDSLVQYYNETDKYVGDFYKHANRLLRENNLSQLPQYAEDAIDDLDECIERVRQLQGPEGSVEYQNAVVTYIEAQVMYVNTMSDEYSHVTDSTSEVEFNRIERLIERTIRERIQKNEAIIEAQRSFAQKHNFKVQNGENE